MPERPWTGGAPVTSSARVRVSVRGQQRVLPSVPVGPNASIAFSGRWLRIGEIHDEFWLPARDVPAPPAIVGFLRQARAVPDLFTFAQRIPDVVPRYPWALGWDSYAVATFDSYAQWFDTQVDRAVRKHVRKAAREGVVAEAVPFTDELVTAISEIYNESPVRQGRPFWHFGKPFATVKAENGTYLERSIFIAARYQGEIIGFLKILVTDEVAAFMQILSKAAHFERRPTNALIAKAVDVCATNGIRHLIYGRYAYGTKREGGLIDFKVANAFAEQLVPRYHVPLTLKGRLTLRLGLHRGADGWMPAPVQRAAVRARAWWHDRRAPSGAPATAGES